MITYIKTKRSSFTYKLISLFIIITFAVSIITPPVYAQNAFSLPAPGTMVMPTVQHLPVILRGVRVDPAKPFNFDFILDNGDSQIPTEDLEAESTKLIKYFLASLTVPEEDLWVNLSPYEQNRIIPNEFGQTEMGRDLLAQDYLLKQLTASLIYPEKEIGQKFWDRVYKKAHELYGTTQIPINTFNKVWILPDKVEIYEKGNAAFIVKSRLKVMLEADYLSLNQNLMNEERGLDLVSSQDAREINDVSSDIVRDILIPEIEKEVNNGENFAPLRQVYHSLILATWYKTRLKEAVLNKVYANKNKIAGVDVEDKDIKDKIYAQYMEAFKKGVYNYIKEDYDEYAGEMMPRKYFSGGVVYTPQHFFLNPQVVSYTNNPSPAAQALTPRAQGNHLFELQGYFQDEAMTGIDRAETVLAADWVEHFTRIDRSGDIVSAMTELLRPDHPLKAEILDEVDRLSDAKVLGEVDRYLNTKRNDDPENFGIRDQLFGIPEGQNITLRQLFLHPTQGEEADLAQVIQISLNFASTEMIQMVMEMESEEDEKAVRSSIRASYLILKGLEILSRRQGIGLIAADDIDTDHGLLFNYSKTKPSVFTAGRLLALGDVLIDPETGRVKSTEAHRSLIILMQLVEKLQGVDEQSETGQSYGELWRAAFNDGTNRAALVNLQGKVSTPEFTLQEARNPAQAPERPRIEDQSDSPYYHKAISALGMPPFQRISYDLEIFGESSFDEIYGEFFAAVEREAQEKGIERALDLDQTINRGLREIRTHDIRKHPDISVRYYDAMVPVFQKHFPGYTLRALGLVGAGALLGVVDNFEDPEILNIVLNDDSFMDVESDTLERIVNEIRDRYQRTGVKDENLPFNIKSIQMTAKVSDEAMSGEMPPNTQTVLAMQNNPFIVRGLTLGEGEQYSETLIRSLGRFVDRSDSAFKKEAFDEIDSWADEKILEEAERYLNTVPSADNQWYGIGDQLQTTGEYAGKTLSLRRLFLHPTAGDIDFRQVMTPTLNIGSGTYVETLMKQDDEEIRLTTASHVKGGYLLLKAYSILSADTDMVLIRARDVADEGDLYNYLKGRSRPEEARNLLSFSSLLIDPQTGNVETEPNRESLRNLIRLIDRLKEDSAWQTLLGQAPFREQVADLRVIVSSDDEAMTAPEMQRVSTSAQAWSAFLGDQVDAYTRLSPEDYDRSERKALRSALNNLIGVHDDGSLRYGADEIEDLRRSELSLGEYAQIGRRLRAQWQADTNLEPRLGQWPHYVANTLHNTFDHFPDYRTFVERVDALTFGNRGDNRAALWEIGTHLVEHVGKLGAHAERKDFGRGAFHVPDSKMLTEVFGSYARKVVIAQGEPGWNGPIASEDGEVRLSATEGDFLLWGILYMLNPIVHNYFLDPIIDERRDARELLRGIYRGGPSSSVAQNMMTDYLARMLDQTGLSNEQLDRLLVTALNRFLTDAPAELKSPFQTSPARVPTGSVIDKFPQVKTQPVPVKYHAFIQALRPDVQRTFLNSEGMEPLTTLDTKYQLPEETALAPYLLFTQAPFRTRLPETAALIESHLSGLGGETAATISTTYQGLLVDQAMTAVEPTLLTTLTQKGRNWAELLGQRLAGKQPQSRGEASRQRQDFRPATDQLLGLSRRYGLQKPDWIDERLFNDLPPIQDYPALGKYLSDVYEQSGRRAYAGSFTEQIAFSLDTAFSRIDTDIYFDRVDAITQSDPVENTMAFWSMALMLTDHQARLAPHAEKDEQGEFHLPDSEMLIKVMERLIPKMVQLKSQAVWNEPVSTRDRTVYSGLTYGDLMEWGLIHFLNPLLHHYLLDPLIPAKTDNSGLDPERDGREYFRQKYGTPKAMMTDHIRRMFTDMVANQDDVENLILGAFDKFLDKEKAPPQLVSPFTLKAITGGLTSINRRVTRYTDGRELPVKFNVFLYPLTDQDRLDVVSEEGNVLYKSSFISTKYESNEGAYLLFAEGQLARLFPTVAARLRDHGRTNDTEGKLSAEFERVSRDEAMTSSVVPDQEELQSVGTMIDLAARTAEGRGIKTNINSILTALRPYFGRRPTVQQLQKYFVPFLEERSRQAELRGSSEYVQQITDDRALQEQVARLLMTGKAVKDYRPMANGEPILYDTSETSFFRDAETYESDVKAFFAEQLRAKEGQRDNVIRIRQASSSTGQELYTIMIYAYQALRDYYRELFPEAADDLEHFNQWARGRVELDAFDLDIFNLGRADAGVYDLLELREDVEHYFDEKVRDYEVEGDPETLADQFILEYFEEQPGGYQIKPEIRNLFQVNYAYIDLRDKEQLSLLQRKSYDVTFSRHTISHYLDEADMPAVLDALKASMAEDHLFVNDVLQGNVLTRGDVSEFSEGSVERNIMLGLGADPYTLAYMAVMLGEDALNPRLAAKKQGDLKTILADQTSSSNPKIAAVSQWALKRLGDEAMAGREPSVSVATHFFRDTAKYKQELNQHVDNLLERRLESGDRSIRIRHVGASNGAEVYSVAIMVYERMKAFYESKGGESVLGSFNDWLATWSIEADAFDIISANITRIQRGVYSREEILSSVADYLNAQATDQVTTDFINDHFERSQEGYRLKKEIRNLIKVNAIPLDLTQADQLPGLSEKEYDVTFAFNVIEQLSSKDPQDRIRVLETLLDTRTEDHLFVHTYLSILRENGRDVILPGSTSAGELERVLKEPMTMIPLTAVPIMLGLVSSDVSAQFLPDQSPQEILRAVSQTQEDFRASARAYADWALQRISDEAMAGFDGDIGLILDAIEAGRFNAEMVEPLGMQDLERLLRQLDALDEQMTDLARASDDEEAESLSFTVSLYKTAQGIVAQRMEDLRRAGGEAMAGENEIEEQRRLFNSQYADLKIFDGSEWLRPQKSMAEEVESILGGRNPNNVKVLNLGSGDGAGGSFWLVKRGFDTVQVDFSENAINRFRAAVAQNATPEEQARTEFKIGDILETLKDMEDNSMDIIHAQLSLQYYRYDMTEEVFRQIRRVLKDNGHFIFKVFSLEDQRLAQGGLERVDDHGHLYRYTDGKFRRLFSAEDVEDLVKNAGGFKNYQAQKITVEGFQNRPWVVIASDEAMAATDRPEDLGGIDFNPANIDMNIRREGGTLPLKLDMQNLENININGLVPVIINITPITNVPLILGEVDKEEVEKLSKL